MRVLICAAVALVAPIADAPGSPYPQLMVVSAPAPAVPVPAYDFVDRAKLPAGAKVLSAAKAANGRVCVVTDKGAFTSEAGGYVSLRFGPQKREPGQPGVPADVKLVAVAADRVGHLWAATDRGLYVTNGEQWYSGLTRQDGVPFEEMTCLHLAANGDLWGGTMQGA